MQYIIAIAIAIFLYFIQDSYYKNHWKEKLSVTIDYNKTYACIGDTLELTEKIENHKNLPLPVLFAKFRTSKSFEFEHCASSAISDHYYRNDAFSILGNQQITRKLPFRVTRRGYFTTDTVNLVAKDLFLIKTYASIEPNNAYLYVYPALLQTRKDITLTNSIIGDILTRNLYEDPLSFRGIRDYCSGDSMRYINWKSTAKSGNLHVNTFFDTEQAHIVLLVNLDTQKLGHTDRLKEYILSIAATLIQQMMKPGFSVELHINSPDPFTNCPLHIPGGNSMEHLHTLFQGISRINIHQKPADFTDYFLPHTGLFHRPETNTSYIILSNYRKHDLLDAYRTRQQEGHSLSFICPDYPAFCNPRTFQPDGLNERTMISNFYFWEITNDEI